jgi:N-dimethylarginine dimethylaminohydrolase
MGTSTGGSAAWEKRRDIAPQDDVRARAAGVVNETGRLRRAVLARPGSWAVAQDRWQRQLIEREVDGRRLGDQADGLARTLEAEGVEVLWAEPRRSGVNFLFLRDLWAMTPFGAILGRPAPRGREGEEVDALRAVCDLDLPLAGVVHAPGTFEGADLLWVDEQSAVLGIGGRTNAPGARQVVSLLGLHDVDVTCLELPGSAQHLLGELKFVRPDLAFVRDLGQLPQLRQWADRHAIRLVDVGAGTGLADPDRRSLNFVTVAPGRVVASPEGRRLRDLVGAGEIAVVEVEVGEYQAAAGGIGCAVAIVRRDG